MNLQELQSFIEETTDTEFEKAFELSDTPSGVGIDSLDLTLLGQELCEKTNKELDIAPDDTFETILKKVNE